MKIRTKINFILIAGFIAIVLVSSVDIYIFGGAQLKQLSGNLISKLNEAKANQIRTFLKGEQEVVLSLSSSSVFRTFLKTPEDSSQYAAQKAIAETRLARSIGSVTQIEELFLLDKNGKIIASTKPENDGTDRSQDPFYINGKTGVYIKSFYFSDITKTNAYAVSAPILDDTTKDLLGLVVARMYPDNLYTAVGSSLSGTKTGENFLVDSNHFLISPGRYLTQKDVLIKKIETQNVKDCFSAAEIKSVKTTGNRLQEETALPNYTDYRGVSVIGTHFYIPETGWCLITKEDISESEAPVAYFSWILILSSLIILVTFVPISFYFSSRMSKNIVALQKSATIVESGDLTQKIEIKAKDEIGDLARSFNKMVESIKQSRADVDRRIAEQTKEITEKQQYMQDQQKATLNILEDIEEEKTKTSALLSGIGEGVIATDINTNVIFINQAAEDLIDWKSDEVMGKKLYDFLKMVDEKDKLISEEQRPFYVALKTGKKIVSSIQKSYYYTKRSGEKFPVNISVTPVIMDGKLIGAINVFRDITHEKEIDKAKTEFVSLASHQLRTPLSAINWYTEMLLAGDAGKITKEQKQYLEEVYHSNKRMVELVNSLLNVSRIDLGTFAIAPESVDIIEVSKSVLMELTPMIKNKNMKIEENYEAKFPKINVDQKLIRIIFQNLLSNAVKYTPDKGKISVTVAKEGENALIRVQDTGYGIPRKDQPRIFEKLFRADNIREKETDGTGLGLYVVKSILEQSGGKISFESPALSGVKGEENKGTTFFVTIPLSGMKSKEGTKDLS